MRELRKDKFRLEHILEAIDRLKTHAGNLSREELESDVLRYYGIVKNIEIIGEAANMLSPTFKETHQEVAWRDIAGMRNFLVQGAMGSGTFAPTVQRDITASIVRNNFFICPVLVAKIRRKSQTAIYFRNYSCNSRKYFLSLQREYESED